MTVSQKLVALSVIAASLTMSTEVEAQSAVPPPVEQISADCTRPVYASDQLVCGDAELKRLDGQLLKLLETVDAKSAEFYEDDYAWFKRRSRCAFEADHKSCLLQAYTNRIKVIEALLGDSHSSSAAVCRNNKNMRRISIAYGGHGQHVIRDDGKKLIGVASKKATPAVWAPFLSVIISGRTYKFASYDGRHFDCKLR